MPCLVCPTCWQYVLGSSLQKAMLPTLKPRFITFLGVVLVPYGFNHNYHSFIFFPQQNNGGYH